LNGNSTWVNAGPGATSIKAGPNDILAFKPGTNNVDLYSEFDGSRTTMGSATGDAIAVTGDPGGSNPNVWLLHWQRAGIYAGHTLPSPGWTLFLNSPFGALTSGGRELYAQSRVLCSASTPGTCNIL
jgi:hypothetical protein